LKEQRDLAAKYGVPEEVQRLRDQAVRIYLLYLVGITIFSDKSQWAVDVVYLKYFRDLDLCAGYSWAAAALAQLYKELNNASRWNTSQVAGYLSLLQYKLRTMFYLFKCKCIWFVYLYVVVFGAGLGVSSLPRYGKQGCLGRICRESVSLRDIFLPLQGLGTVDNYINYLDALDLTRVVMAPYAVHRQARQFEQVSHYFGWLRCGERMVRYLSERVLRQFGWVQTIPRHHKPLSACT
jgi:hypothetical protein